MNKKCLIKVLLLDFLEIGGLITFLGITAGIFMLFMYDLGFLLYQFDIVKKIPIKNTLYEHYLILGVMLSIFIFIVGGTIALIKDIIKGIINYISNLKYRCRK